jgi:hypothetical protein
MDSLFFCLVQRLYAACSSYGSLGSGPSANALAGKVLTQVDCTLTLQVTNKLHLYHDETKQAAE